MPARAASIPPPQAPDYAQPFVGWRVWDVVETDGELRLASLCFRTFWEPRRATSAVCRRSAVMLASTFLGPHEAPHQRCACGVYATRTGMRAAPYLSRHFRGTPGAVHRVAGRVSLWGTVVEATRGWRASHAYPQAIFVPTAPGGLRALLGGLRSPALPVEEIAAGLSCYGVPVEILDCAFPRELAALVEPQAPAPLLPPA